MTDVRDIPTWRLREAARAWRMEAEKASRLNLGPLSFLAPGPNLSTYDRVHELVEEIARLRALVGRYEAGFVNSPDPNRKLSANPLKANTKC